MRVRSRAKENHDESRALLNIKRKREPIKLQAKLLRHWKLASLSVMYISASRRISVKTGARNCVTVTIKRVQNLTTWTADPS